MLPPCPGRFSTITVSPSAGPESLGQQARNHIGGLPRREADQDAREFGTPRIGQAQDQRRDHNQQAPHVVPLDFVLYRSGGAQPLDFLSRQSQRAIGLVIVLAECRTGAAHRYRGFRKARHHALHPDIAEFVVSHADDGFARDEVRVGKDIGRIIDRREADLMRMQAAAQFVQRQAGDGARARWRRSLASFSPAMDYR